MSLTEETAELSPSVIARQPAPAKKQPLQITGMWGIGDNLHQRAALKELIKQYDIWLETCHAWLYHDLLEDGLKLMPRPTRLWMHSANLQRELHLFRKDRPPRGTPNWKIWYLKDAIDKHGSILGAMNASFFMAGMKNPDFSLPIPEAWRRKAGPYIDKWRASGKPLMLYRPIVLRREWDSKARNPDTEAYRQIFASVRSSFFVVSIASLQAGIEWIVGPEESSVDVKLHHGELDFETMAAVFEDADMVFCNAGFAPVMAQAVGTPSIVVYGGRESFRTSNAAGAHLAPTLGIDPVNPCDCHSNRHHCDKRIDVPIAIERAKMFVTDQMGMAPVQEAPASTGPKVLIFGTVYQDNKTRAALTEHWMAMHQCLNPDCDFLLVDSQSPVPIVPNEGVEVFNFPDNIGHLSRPKVTQGRDGWGRAFCKGLQIAIDRNYDYVVHIEGDSLFRVPCKPIAEKMRREGIKAISTPVTGMKVPGAERGWCETGLMFFSVDYLRQSNFIEKYNWPKRTAMPTPEVIVRQIIGDDLSMVPWLAWRADKNQINSRNIMQLGLHWVTHCHNDVNAYAIFADDAIRRFSGEKPDLAKDYDQKFFDMHRQWKPQYEKMAEILDRHISFESVVDLGCGNGYLLSALKRKQKTVVGVDGSPVARNFFPVVIADITEPLDIGKYDLAICTEVAEHIHANYADALVENICKVAGHAIFFSAAKAGHGGHLHINEQERPYWSDKFMRRGFVVDEARTEAIKSELDELKPIWWFAANSFVMVKAN